jgi:GH35 family endo-1,4-beta-xylanase
MLRFAVYDENGPAREWPLVNAHLLGPGDQATSGEISFEKGWIVCKTRAAHTVALALAHDAGSAGRLSLQTCLLPDRDRPYDLTLELARHRIKMFIAKSEEWQLFELAPEHRAVRRWEKARSIFSEALVLDDPLEREAAAGRALTTAIEATEALALTHADMFLHWRFTNRPAPATTRELEVEEGKFRWEPIDRWLEWARKEGKPVVLGPLLDFSKRALPKWMYVWQHDFNTCRDLVYEQVERVVHRYKSLVAIWNIASGVNVNDNFQFTAEQMIDLTRMSNLIARQARRGARTMIELAQPFGEYCATNKNALGPYTFVERCMQEGIRIDCVGLQLLFGDRGGHVSRDLAQVSDLVDRFAFLEMPVVVSAMGVPDEVVDEQGGWWHRRWTPEVQSSWTARMFGIALSKPFVESVVWTDLYDHPAAEPAHGGLVTATGQPKPALGRLISARKTLKKPLGPPKLQLRSRESRSSKPDPAGQPGAPASQPE